MSQPRNNLEALQHQIPPQQKSSYFAATQSPKVQSDRTFSCESSNQRHRQPTKFKPAKAITALAHNATTQPSSFSSPGCGKEKSYHPVPAVTHVHPGNEAIDISSSDSTSPASTRSIPNKRASSDSGPALPLSPKRQRIAVSISDKENACSVPHKGKAREGQSPLPSQHHGVYALAPPSEDPQSTSFAPLQPVKTSRRIATRTVAYNYKVHSDLRDRTAEELQLLYEIDDTHFHKVRRDRDQYRMRKASNYDPYILDGLLDLLEDRLHAITDTIATFGSDSEDSPLPKSTEGFLRAVTPSTSTYTHDLTHDSEISSLIHKYETHPPTSTVGSPRAVTPSTRTHTHDFTHDSEISSVIYERETQLFDEDIVEDDTPISSATISHGSTLVADTTGHIPGLEKMVDDSARANPTGPQSPHLSASHAAGELNDRQNVRQSLSSEDDLWNHVDGNMEDDSVELVSPDANKPAPLFSAVATLRPPPAEAPSEASLKASPYYPEVVEKLRNVFRLKAFRKNQLAAVISTLDGRDAIVLMPTGGGKSLCYQLPAVCRGGKTSGVTIVVTPLRALMADQVESLRAKRINVMMLASMEDGDSMQELRTAANKPSLVYITPERLDCSDAMKGILKGLYARQQLARFVVDEAHLINTWGRDFRSEGYASLRGLRTEYPGIPIVALTATATSEALQDIVTTLGLSDYVLLSQSFNRPNLRYKVIPKKRDIEGSIYEFIQGNYPDQTGIIYCIARAKTEEVAKKLRMQGLDARHFHAGMVDGDRKRVQQQWQNDECRIIVATVAFGMGVDKADVRFVIHFDAPGSIDAYCQETGRAGRDGEVADCILYYSYYDVQRRMLQINKDTEINEEQKNRKRQALYTVNAFCLNEIDCRRMLILNHFTEAFDPASCNGTCDNCTSTGEVAELDLTGSAISFVKLIQESRKHCMKVTGPLGIHAFRGTSASEMARRHFNTLEQFGKGSKISADLAKRLFDHLVAHQILSTELEEAQVPNRAPISYVYLGPKADAFLSERQPFLLKVRSTKKGIGAPKSKSVATPVSTISVRRKRPRAEATYDPVEPFPPRDAEPVFDDIEPEPEIEEPSTPPLVRARRRRASPSIQVFDEPREQALDNNQECYKALYALRGQFAAERACDPQDILVDEVLETLSCMLPDDAVAFKEVLAMSQELDADEVHDKWLAFGGRFLDITSKYAMRMRAKSSASFTPAELHERFDYLSTKPVGEQ